MPGRMSARLTVRTFLQALGLIYAIAFTSFGVQASGLIGSHGILPYADYLNGMRQELGRAAYWDLPALFWLNSSDAALQIFWIAGALAGLATIFVPWRR